MRVINYIFILIILLCIILFAIYNSNAVKIDYILGVKEIPLALVLAISLITGAFLGFITSIIKFLKLKKENFRLKHDIKIAKKEISNLREMPLRESH